MPPYRTIPSNEEPEILPWFYYTGFPVPDLRLNNIFVLLLPKFWVKAPSF
jgi:hypothetical protein